MSTITPGVHESDSFGHIEARGIDFVPASERHGRPLDLFWVWMAANVNYLYVILGGLLTVLGLTIWQALVVVLIGNLFWAAIGFLAISGPAAGAPSSVITRSMFGVRGNRIFVGVFNWPVFIAYEAINLALGAVAGFALAAQLGLSTNRPTQVAVVVLTAAATLAISVYGHATIVKMSGVFTAVLTLGMVVLGGFVLVHADWNYVVDPSWAPTGGAVWATAIAGVTIIAAAPLSWGISADYARYLPETLIEARHCDLDRAGWLHPVRRAGCDRRARRDRGGHERPADQSVGDPAGLVLRDLPADDHRRLHHQQRADDVQLGAVSPGRRHPAVALDHGLHRRDPGRGTCLLRVVRQ